MKTRDKSPNQNESSWSAPTDVTTWSVPNGTLVKFGFQCPYFDDNTILSDGDFAGWVAYSTPKVRLNGQNGAPSDNAYPSPNRVIWFENTDNYMAYDVSHNWSASDIYTLTVNAAPQATWNYDKQRYVRPSILEQDGTVLWAAGENMSGPEKTALPKSSERYCFTAQVTASDEFHQPGNIAPHAKQYHPPRTTTDA